MKKTILITTFLFGSFFHPLSLAGLSTEIETDLQPETESISPSKPKIAYTILHNTESNEFCYVSAFDRKDIVPDFAEPADYETALSVEKPPFKQCSDEEVALISSYRTSSVLLDEDGIELAGVAGLAWGVCALSSAVLLWGFLDGEIEGNLHNKIAGGATGIGALTGVLVGVLKTFVEPSYPKSYLMASVAGGVLGGIYGLSLGVCVTGIGYTVYHVITK